MVLASVLSYFQSFIPGSRLVDGGDCLNLAKLLFTPTTGIVALAGGGQAGATQLQQGMNRVDTAGAGGTDSVVLPPAIAGSFVVVNNNSGQAIQVFGIGANAGGGQSTGDTIATSSSNTQVATGTGISLANTKIAIFYCFIN